MGDMSDDLTTVPNIGPAIAAKLRRLGITCAAELGGRDPEELFERLCALDGLQHDVCLLDTFAAAVSFADGGPARPWWEFSRARKAASARIRAEPDGARAGATTLQSASGL
jgi:hypothetical protein